MHALHYILKKVVSNLLINLSEPLVVCPFVSVSAQVEVWTDQLCAASHGRSFSSLWAAFTLTAHINALYNERVYGKEEHAT